MTSSGAPASAGPASTTAAASTALPSIAGAPNGFGSVAVRLTEPGGQVCERCLLLAETVEQRRRGLMGVTSLGGYDGMAFRYDAPTSTSFWMRDTVLPLSIGFYDAAGALLDRAEMDPCTTANCPSFAPGTPFSIAIEVAQGSLDELGFTVTAALELLDRPCDPAPATLRTG